MRISKDKYYLNIAEAVSKRSPCLRRQYGSVIVKNDEIIATGYNGVPRGCKHCETCNRVNVPRGQCYENCLAGDTVIKLLDGTYPTIRELAENHKSVWVYSVDDKTGEIVPAIAHDARKIKRVKSLIRIYFDDGGHIDCTPDHKFLTRDLQYKKAKNLHIGESIMPCNYRFGNANHEYVRNTPLMCEESRWILSKVKCATHSIATHSLVYSFFNGIIPEGYVVHHVDFNSLNNVPDNLVIMRKNRHNAIHGCYRFKNGLTKFGTSELSRKGGEAQKVTLRNNPEIRKKKSECGKRNMTANWNNQEWIRKTQATRIKNGRLIARKFNSEPRCIKRRREGLVAKGISNLLYMMKIAGNTEHLTIENYEEMKKLYKPHIGKGKFFIPKLKTILDCYGDFDIAIEAGKNWNHKIIKIEFIDYDDWVYDITVDDTHNFAVRTSEGNCVIVHNCNSVHAEANAIISAARRDMIGATLYLACNEKDAFPCKDCQRLIINAGISKVITEEKICDVQDWIGDE